MPLTKVKGAVWDGSDNGQAASVKDFGAKGDGVSDDTSALQAALTYLQTSGGSLFFPVGVYRTSATLTLTSANGFTIYGNNATIKKLDSAPIAGGYGGIQFVSCSNGAIYNLNLDGNRAARGALSITSSHQYDIQGGSNLIFDGCKSDNSIMDGWYLRGTDPATQATYPTDIVIRDCSANNSYRNGLSAVGSVRLKIVRGKYSGSTGTAPQAGIDIEPNASDVFGNTSFLVDGVSVTDNAGRGFSVASTTVKSSGTVQGLVGKNNTDGFMILGGADGVDIFNPVCLAHSATTNGLVQIPSGGNNISIHSPVFLGITASGAGLACIKTNSASTGIKIFNMVVRVSALAAIVAQGKVLVDGVDVEGCTDSSSCISSSFAGSVLRNIRINGFTGNYSFYTSGANTVLEECYVSDATSTIACVRFDTGSTGSIARNITAYQSSGSVPGGQYALRCDVAMQEISNISGLNGYTSANMLNMSAANIINTRVGIIEPNPLEVSFTYDPASIAAGAGNLSTAQALALANLGDACVVRPPYDMQGVNAYAFVSSTGNVKLSLQNSTAGAIDLASGTWKIKLNKA